MLRIMHIDFNSYFATVEQQANPRLRGKPIGVTGGDRVKRTVLGAASIEAKKFGVKTGMQIWQAKKLCPHIILVPGDSDKYLTVTKKFLNILKSYSPYLEVFSIDEAFLEVNSEVSETIAQNIKDQIKQEIGEWMRVSIGISYNKLMAKLASGLKKPDGLVIINNPEEAVKILDNLPLEEICGIGSSTKHHLHKMGIFTFKQLREIPLEILTFEFKSYGYFLYNAARGIDYSPITPFYEKPEVKSIGHRLTISQDTNNLIEIKQILLKLTELISGKLRAKKLVGKTVSCWFRYASHFTGGGEQVTIPFTNDGLTIFKAAWESFHHIWEGDKIRMIGASISNLQPQNPQNLTFIENDLKQEKIIKALDIINNQFGEFTLQRGALIHAPSIKRKPNPFLSDRRFRL